MKDWNKRDDGTAGRKDRMEGLEEKRGWKDWKRGWKDWDKREDGRTGIKERMEGLGLKRGRKDWKKERTEGLEQKNVKALWQKKFLIQAIVA